MGQYLTVKYIIYITEHILNKSSINQITYCSITLVKIGTTTMGLKRYAGSEEDIIKAKDLVEIYLTLFKKKKITRTFGTNEV